MNERHMPSPSSETPDGILSQPAPPATQRSGQVLWLFVAGCILLAALLGIGGGMFITLDDSEAGIQESLPSTRSDVPSRQ